jgi:hypothetical protein
MGAGVDYSVSMLSEFFSILGRSWSTFRAALRYLIVMALVLSVFYVLGVSTLSQSLEYDAETIVRSFGIDQKRFTELSQKMEEGDQEATLELMQEVNAVAERYEHMTPEEQEAYVEEQVILAFEKLAPRYFLYGFMVLLLAIAGMTYSLLTYIQDHGHVLDIFRHSIALFLPMVGLSIWVWLRSFAWVSIVGLFPGLELFLPLGIAISAVALLILMPLLLISPVLLVQEGSIHKAVSTSLQRSKGHWAKLALYTVLTLLLVCVVHAVVGMGLSILEPYSNTAAVFSSGVLQQLSIAFVGAYLLQLSTWLPANNEQ